MATNTHNFSDGIGAEKDLKPTHSDVLENFTTSPARGTYLDDEDSLSIEHKDYLMNRHGTFDLDPVPDMGEGDPYNWPQWKKVVNLVLVTFHAFMATFTAASIMCAFEIIALDLGKSLQTITYLTSLQIAILGVAPLIWKPFANTYGRRPIFLLSLICSLIGNIGCAKSPSYATMMVCRAIVSFFICPAVAIGSAVVTETFFKQDRAKYIGVWTLMVTLGVPISPFIFGFVAQHVGYRWIYWILAMINGAQLVLYFFFGPETRYIRSGISRPAATSKVEYFNLTRIDPRPLRVIDFIHPLLLAIKPRILIPTIACSMTFLMASVFIAINIPQFFGAKFHFNPQQVGYQYVALIIGSVIGEQLGGPMSDWWMNSKTRKMAGKRPAPEYRLWLSYGGFILATVGLVVFLVQTDRAKEGKWNVTPLVGVAISGVGNQIITTVLITYAIDCHLEESASIGVLITFARQIWGFIGPFWFPKMIDSVGLAGSAGIGAALIVGVSILPTVAIQFFGKRIGKQNGREKVEDFGANGTGSLDKA